MLTLFATLKSFRDPHIAMIQKNALQSWMALKPQCEILLLGNDEGVKEAAKEYHITHIPGIKANGQGLPFVNSLFREAEREARFSTLCYVNGDIIVMNDFLRAIQSIASMKPLFLVVGRRWDVEMRTSLSFTHGWQRRLLRLVHKKGILHSYSGIDFFVFPKGALPYIPDLVVGRAGWDNWMIFNARSRRIPVVDITPSATIIHQNHDLPGKRETDKRFSDKNAQHNILLAGGYKNLFTIRDADYRLQGGQLKQTWSGRVSFFYPLRLLLSLKRAFLKSYGA